MAITAREPERTSVEERREEENRRGTQVDVFRVLSGGLGDPRIVAIGFGGHLLFFTCSRPDVS